MLHIQQYITFWKTKKACKFLGLLDKDGFAFLPEAEIINYIGHYTLNNVTILVKTYHYKMGKFQSDDSFLSSINWYNILLAHKTAKQNKKNKKLLNIN